MNLEQVTFSFSTVQWLVLAAIGVYSWFVGRLSASAKDVTELRMRVIEMETTLEHMPTSGQMAQLNAQLSKLDAEMDGIQRELNKNNAILDRINSYLLNNK